MKLTLRLVLSLAAAIALLALLLAWADAQPAAVAAALKRLDPRVYWAATGVQAAIYVFRGFRFQELVPDPFRPTLLRTIPVAAAHNLAAYVLPAKVGEAALVVYLKRVSAVPSARGLAVLLVSRLLDLAVLAGGLALACLALGLAGTGPGDWLLPLGAVLLGLTLVFGWSTARSEYLVGGVTSILRALGLERSGLGRRVAGAAERVRSALGDLGRGHLLRGALASIPVWGCVFLFYAILARGLGLEALTYPEAVFGSSLAVLTSLLPVSVFAGFGTQDAGWVAGFTALGVSRELALESALAVHLVYLFNLCVFGLLGHLWMGLSAPPVVQENG